MTWASQNGSNLYQEAFFEVSNHHLQDRDSSEQQGLNEVRSEAFYTIDR